MLYDPRALTLSDELPHEHEAVPSATRAIEADREVEGIGTVAENAGTDLPHRCRGIPHWASIWAIMLRAFRRQPSSGS